MDNSASEAFVEALPLEAYGYALTEGKTTDILALTFSDIGVSCINVPAGYHNPHKDDEYTLLVEGHTAAVGKPTGEMNLSYLRAMTIIDELVARGIKRDICEAKGYGGTKPIGDNSTEEGRAKNRRVEIVVRPKVNYIQISK